MNVDPRLGPNSLLSSLRVSGCTMVKEKDVADFSLVGLHMVVRSEIIIDNKSVPLHALIDCGATGFSFVDEEFARQHNLPLVPLKEARSLEVIDGRPISSGDITHICKVPFMIDNHFEHLPMFVTALGHYPLVLGIPWLRRHGPSIDFEANTLTFNSPRCLEGCLSKPLPVTVEAEDKEVPRHKQLQVAMIGAAAFLHLVNKQHLEVFSVTLAELKNTPQAAQKDLRELVPEEYHSFLDLFDEAKSDKLPPRRPYDHKIPLKNPNSAPPFRPMYSMSHNELEVIRKYIEENLSKGFIRSSSSPAGAPVLFVKKKDGTLRLCVDYRALNELTIKNRYPLPLIQETLMRLQKAQWYTRLDARNAYNLLRIAEGDEWKTAFRTRFGHFEYTVMPFGLTNAPASWQHFINDVLRPYLDIFCTAYLDDILIYSDTLDEHKVHVRQVLDTLKEAGVHLKPEKCEFHVQETNFLGLIVSPNGIRMEPTKITAVQNWETPSNVKDVQTFLGFANFYRRFILGYSKIVAPLTALTRKDTPFVWTPACQSVFDSLKTAFTSAPILRHFDPEKDIVVETDASDFVSGGVLSQPDESGILHPVAFFSKKHSPAECNYEIYDKELLAIVRCFEEWRPHLESAPTTIKVLSDHKNLEYFMTTKNLNRRQARWSEFLSRFDFQITYRPGKQGGKPDALTRRSGDLPNEGGDERQKILSQTVLKPQNLDPAIKAPTIMANGAWTRTREDLHLEVSATNPAESGPTLDELFAKGFEHDPTPDEILEQLRTGAQRSKHIALSECSVDEQGRLRYRQRIYVPDWPALHLRLLQMHHDDPAAGHPGRSKTFELLAREYFWPSMRKDCERYVKNCHTCLRSKPVRHAPYGTLKSLPVPQQPWVDVALDFVTGLPLTSENHDAVMNVVCRLTKQRHHIPCNSAIDPEGSADLYIKHVFPYHGLPDSIVSDRGSQFNSRFWKRLCFRLGIDSRLSTAFHPQTDGQTEIINATMETYIRSYVNYLQDDWESFLPIAEFAANNQVSETTGVSPFFANYGFNPRFTVKPRSDQPPRNNDELHADQNVELLQEIHAFCRSEMAFAQARQTEYANKSRLPAPSFQVGDLVTLNARNIKTIRPSKKLDWKRLGPFPVEAIVSSHAYRLTLPATMKVHPVFHVSLLEPAASNPLPGQHNPPPPPIEVDNEEEFEIEDILDSRHFGRNRRLQYLVRWTGYPDPTWEPAENLEEAAALDRFHHLFPDKPGPLSQETSS